MRIAVAQTNPVIGALEKNTDEILVAMMRARKEGADIILFPETAICGYPAEDLLLLPCFGATLAYIELEITYLR